MRGVIVFFVIAIVMSLLRRGRGRGAGSPAAPPPGLDRIPSLLRGTPFEPSPQVSGPKAKPDPVRDAKLAKQVRTTRARVDRQRTETQRRIEAEAANATATAPGGPHTASPGGIDPRLLQRDRTPTPTPEPLHPR